MNSLQTRLRKIEAATPETQGSFRVVFERIGGREKADREQVELEAQGHTVMRVQFVSADKMREGAAA